jgi:hypothetical protein
MFLPPLLLLPLLERSFRKLACIVVRRGVCVPFEGCRIQQGHHVRGRQRVTIASSRSVLFDIHMHGRIVMGGLSYLLLSFGHTRDASSSATDEVMAPRNERSASACSERKL